MMRRTSFLDFIDLFVDPDHSISSLRNFSVMVHNLNLRVALFASGAGSDSAALVSVLFVFLVLLWCWDSEGRVIVGAYAR